MQEWIINITNSLGYLGIGLLMFLENLFPPIPSELIMPLAGFTASQGKMDIFLAIAAGTLGTILGAIPWYYAGLLLGEQRLCLLANRYGKWFGISGDDILKATRWFNRHGIKAVLFCRLVPGVRTLISIPAGIGKMPLVPFLFYSTIGTIAWVSLLAYAGFALGSNYKLVDTYIDPISKVVLAAIAIALTVFILRRTVFKRKAQKKDPSS
ncbi:DedA family protein [Tumidithrix elongata RA019]|uniref:DedA family protein n=1 Tax=Tumidithrix elongata BACA0141 TaxID=2716417 RepID=A0AAW9Q9S4_9CYAN|nr:DedA family protein [Tumidithrix elongata RA019]